MRHHQSKKTRGDAPFQFTPPCPTPQKARWHKEKIATKVANKHTEQSGVQIEPYLCPCGLWHIRQVEKNRQAERRIRAGIRRKYWRAS